MMMLSAFQNLNNEGGALWLLYTFPHSVADVLKQKAQLWAVLALIYPAMVLLTGLFLLPTLGWQYLGLSALALAGVVVYAVIAVALAVFASNPLAQEQMAKLKPSYLYLFMLLGGAYGYAIAAAVWWQSLIFLVLAIFLALALWQKASDQLPYLLDPSASPPARVSTSDGLIAAMMFFVIQIIVMAFFVAVNKKPGGMEVLFSFCCAGALTWLMVRLAYWRAKTTHVPKALAGLWQGTAWRNGLAFGLLAAAIGAAYLVALHHLGLDQVSVNPGAGGKLPWWLIALAVLAAPLFEEFIFRGLIFGGLRRSVALLPAAVGSAAVFAVVHPPASILPVFALGVCAALAYERSKLLWAPMLTHAVYNGVVISVPLLLF